MKKKNIMSCINWKIGIDFLINFFNAHTVIVRFLKKLYTSLQNVRETIFKKQFNKDNDKERESEKE